MDDNQSSASLAESSYQNLSHAPPSSDDDIDSLPSTSATSTTVPSIDGDNDAEREWRESLQQLELILTMVLVPYIGKYFGRKAAYWGWGKYMEWQYPVKVEITNSKLFKGVGMIEAAASL